MLRSQPARCQKDVEWRRVGSQERQEMKSSASTWIGVTLDGVVELRWTFFESTRSSFQLHVGEISALPVTVVPSDMLRLHFTLIDRLATTTEYDLRPEFMLDRFEVTSTRRTMNIDVQSSKCENLSVTADQYQILRP